MPTAETTRGTVLVVGADGFIGGFIQAALRTHGWRVLRGVRTAGRDTDARGCDLASMHAPADWTDALDGVDAVVNVGGILRERAGQRFADVHERGPHALAQACVARGIGRFVQISAQGAPQDGEFIASKHRFDDALLAMPLQAVVLRPSVIYAPSGSYGGTSLLRALAAFPGVLPVPGHGRWPIHPVAADDLARLVVHALDTGARGLFDVAADETLALRDYQARWRRWLRIPDAPVVAVPQALVSMQVAMTEWLGRGPMGRATWRMLRRGNVGDPGAHARLLRAFGWAPRRLDEVLVAQPSQVQDRWHARLYLLGPLLHATIVLLWLISGVAGLLTPSARIEALAADSVLRHLHPVALARATAVLDLLLAAWLASGRHVRRAIELMVLSVLAFTAAFGVLLPTLWLDPLGGLAKNLVVLPALAVLWVLSDRR